MKAYIFRAKGEELYWSDYSFVKDKEKANVYSEKDFNKEFVLKAFSRTIVPDFLRIISILKGNGSTYVNKDLQFILQKVEVELLKSKEYQFIFGNSGSKNVYYHRSSFSHFSKDTKKAIVDAIFTYFELEEFELIKPKIASKDIVWLKAWK